MYNCFKSVLHLLEQSVRLQNVDDADKNQEVLALVVSGWDPALHPAVGDVVLVEGIGLDALHWGGVGHQLCHVRLERPFSFLNRLFSFTQVSLGLVEVVDAQEERVVHVIVALKKVAVSLYCGHQCLVGLRVNVEALWDHVKEIKILEGWRFLCPLLCRCLTKREKCQLYYTILYYNL